MSPEQPSFYAVFLSLVEQGEYEIDTMGRVFHLRNRRTGRSIHSRCDYIDKYEYRRVVFPYGGKSRNCMVHRLVWMRLKGPVPDGLEINHKDGDKQNNLIGNLELVTASENTLHAMYVLHRTTLYGSRHCRAKLKLRDIARVFWWYGHGVRKVEIASRLGVSRGHVGRILKRRSWRVFV